MMNMTQSTLASAVNREAFEARLAQLHEPDWLVARRRQAWDAFEQLDWPSRQEEEWMRTDIRLFKLENFGLPPGYATSHQLPAAILSDGVQLAGQSMTLDGQARTSQLNANWAAQGVIFCDLSQALAQHADLIECYLGQAVSHDLDRFSALHAAACSGGHFLYVPRHVVLDQPLHAMSALSDGGSDFGHTLVIVEEGAEATLMTEMTSPHEEATGLHCGAIELFVGQGALLRFVDLQTWGRGVWHFAHQKAIVQTDARLQWTMAAIGSRLAKVNQHVALAGEGAESQVNGVLFTEGKQHLSYHTLQHHQKPNTRSDFLYKAALQDRSRTVWRGMIKVDVGAQKTDGYQRNDNLLLSANARADSIPGLEIKADDVRCTHGSTSGRVDEELIFYAQARGFTRQEAIRMIVSGFFQQIFDRISIESVRDALAHAMGRRVREYV